MRVVIPTTLTTTRRSYKIINPRDVSRQWVITIQIGPVCQGTNGRWIPRNEWGGKGQGNVTYPDGHTALLYQTRPCAIELWGRELQTSTSPRTQSLSGPPT